MTAAVAAVGVMGASGGDNQATPFLPPAPLLLPRARNTSAMAVQRRMSCEVPEQATTTLLLNNYDTILTLLIHYIDCCSSQLKRFTT